MASGSRVIWAARCSPTCVLSLRGRNQTRRRIAPAPACARLLARGGTRLDSHPTATAASGPSASGASSWNPPRPWWCAASLRSTCRASGSTASRPGSTTKVSARAPGPTSARVPSWRRCPAAPTSERSVSRARRWPPGRTNQSSRRNCSPGPSDCAPPRSRGPTVAPAGLPSGTFWTGCSTAPTVTECWHAAGVTPSTTRVRGSTPTATAPHPMPTAGRWTRRCSTTS